MFTCGHCKNFSISIFRRVYLMLPKGINIIFIEFSYNDVLTIAKVISALNIASLTLRTRRHSCANRTLLAVVATS